VRIVIICPIGRAYDKQWELTELQKEWLDKTMSELRQKHKDQITIQWEEEESEREHWCRAGFTRWVIASKGNVYPCGSLRIPIGNVARDDPVEICNSPAVRFLQDLVAPHEALCCNCEYLYICKECHGQAVAHYFKVDYCGWVQKFEKAPEPSRSVFW
jgi:radical SAM protein with 4Fe4S-binding SPASM domain